MAYISKSERAYRQALTIHATGGASAAIGTMLRLAVDPCAGELRNLAADWVWRHCRVLITDECGCAVSRKLRRRQLAVERSKRAG